MCRVKNGTNSVSFWLFTRFFCPTYDLEGRLCNLMIRAGEGSEEILFAVPETWRAETLDRRRIHSRGLNLDPKILQVVRRFPKVIQRFRERDHLFFGRALVTGRRLDLGFRIGRRPALAQHRDDFFLAPAA